jgi:HSP20 family protein
MEIVMLNGFRTFEPLRELDLAFRALDRLSDVARIPVATARSASVVALPAVDAFENKEAYVFAIEVPGVAEADVKVSVEKDVLSLRAERKAEVPDGHEVHLRERASVAFARSFELPGPVDADAVAATLKNGVLTITLPKAKGTLPRQIAVKSA